MGERLTHVQIQGLLGAFALDAVEGAERALVEDHLASCPRCADEVRAHREVASLLAYAGSTAPEGLWERIALSLETAPPPAAAPPLPALLAVRAPTPPPAAPVRRSSQRLGRVLALAAAFAVLTGTGLGVRSLRQTLDDQRRQIAAVETGVDRRDVSAIAAAAATSEGARSVHLLDVRGVKLADATVLPSGEAYLVPKGLPALPPGETYQLWSVATGNAMISSGVLGRTPRTTGFTAPDGLQFLALTVETSPGVAVSSKPRLAYAVVPAAVDVPTTDPGPRTASDPDGAAATGLGDPAPASTP